MDCRIQCNLNQNLTLFALGGEFVRVSRLQSCRFSILLAEVDLSCQEVGDVAGGLLPWVVREEVLPWGEDLEDTSP